MKDALRHISNRKEAEGDDIPIELLKAGGEVLPQLSPGVGHDSTAQGGAFGCVS